MKYLKKILLVLILFFSINSFSQNEIIAVSSDDQFIAVIQESYRISDTIFIKDSVSYTFNSTLIYNTLIEIFEPSTGKHIENIELKTKNEINIKDAFFSKNKYTFCVNDNGRYHLWNIPSGKKIKTIDADTLILSNQANSFYAVQDNKIIKESYFYSTKSIYECGNNRTIVKIGITSDDKFLLAKTNVGSIYVWEIRTNNNVPKIIFGDDFSTDNIGNFYISKFNKGKINITKYNAPNSQIEYERDRIISSKSFIKSGKFFKRKIINDKSGFSPGRKYYVYASKKLFSKRITIVNLQTGKKVFETEKIYKRYNKNSPYFYSDSIFFLQKNSNEISVYDINKKRVIDNIESDKKISHNQVLFNQNAIAIIENSSSIDIIEDNNNAIQLSNYKPVSGINNDKTHYFVKNTNNELKYFPISSIMTDTIALQLDKPVEKQRKVKKDFGVFRLDTVAYVSIDDLVHISDNEDTTICLIAKSVQITDDYTGLQFYVVDNQNNYYYGISEDDWQNVICGVTIENEFGETMKIDDYQILEFSEKRKTSVAMCFVLDHSGSMGEINARLMQTGLIGLSENIKRNEAVSIIKFDDSVVNVVDLTTRKSKIARDFGVVGLDDFGGGTALLDGINCGLDVLIENYSYLNKALIVLTDGYENASSSTKNDVLLKAMKNQIGIYSIGFGSSIDVEFLQSISTNTSGGYYWINDNSLFDDVFSDVYKNMKNYYSLNFSTPYPGQYKITLELCYDNVHDSIVYYFDNYVPDLLFTDNQKEYDSLFYEITGVGDTISIDDFNSYKIYENIEFTEFRKEFDSLIFPDIKFHFDETRIVEGTDKELINVIEFLKKYPHLRIEVQGHTDNRGGYLYNEKLSQARAEKVRQMIVAQGINAQRVRTIGYGETKPIDTNYTDKGRQENRRVEFLLVK